MAKKVPGARFRTDSIARAKNGVKAAFEKILDGIPTAPQVLLDGFDGRVARQVEGVRFEGMGEAPVGLAR